MLCVKTCWWSHIDGLSHDYGNSILSGCSEYGKVCSWKCISKGVRQSIGAKLRQLHISPLKYYRNISGSKIFQYNLVINFYQFLIYFLNILEKGIGIKSLLSVGVPDIYQWLPQNLLKYKTHPTIECHSLALSHRYNLLEYGKSIVAGNFFMTKCVGCRDEVCWYLFSTTTLSFQLNPNSTKKCV